MLLPFEGDFVHTGIGGVMASVAKANQEWKISVLSVAVLLAVIFTFDTAQKSSFTSTQQAGQSSIVLVPREVTLGVGKKKTISVNIDSSEDKISGVELVFSFDPKIVRVDAVLIGDFLPNSTVFINEVDNQAGKARFNVGTLTPRMGEGAVAYVRLTALKAGKTSILPVGVETRVAAVGKTGDVLGKTDGAFVTVQTVQ